MISNTTCKLKASKSSRELKEEYIENKNKDNIPIEDNENNSHSVNLQPENENNFNRVFFSREGRFKNRNRTYEYRPSRGYPAERRGCGSWRGRGSFGHRRYEYDTPEAGTYVSRKFQEPLNKHTSESSKSLYYSKYYESDNNYEHGLNSFEDTRISKLIRRLTQETDQEKAIGLCRKLLEALMEPGNARYVRRAFSMLVEALFDVLGYGPGAAVKHLAARVLGRVGYVMESDFQRFLHWQFSEKFPVANDEMKILLIASMKEILYLEKYTPQLQVFADDIMGQIQTLLETTNASDVFMKTLDILLMLDGIYPETVSLNFRDIVDILLGWHVDNNHAVAVVECASKCLVKLSKHWQCNISFSLNLINQFLEDLDAYLNELNSNTNADEDNTTKVEDMLERLTIILRVFNTVIKCLGKMFHPNHSPDVKLDFVTKSFEKVIKVGIAILDSFIPDNLIITTNESIVLLLNVLQNKSAAVSQSLYNLIDLELSLVEDFSDNTVISMLLMISKTIKELSANLPIELVQKLVGPRSELLTIRFHPCETVQNAVIDVYHSLLNLKNIPLLQEAYRCVLGDLEQAYILVVPNTKPFCQNNPFAVRDFNIWEAELTCLFLLRCLSLLANASGSIIGMWALRPSILELLALNLEPHNLMLTLKAPTLQYSIFYLLYSHSKCYNHFVSSSNLVNSPNSKAHVMDKLILPGTINAGDVSTTSPSSGNLTIILNILIKSLKTDMNIETSLLILNWLQEIFLQSKIFLNTLCLTIEFKEMTHALISSGYVCETKVLLSIYKNLKILLSCPKITWSSSFLISINNLCVLHLNSTVESVQQSYANLMTLLPWHIITHSSNTPTAYRMKNSRDISIYNRLSIEIAQHLHMKKSNANELLQMQFKKFISYLLQGTNYDGNWMADIFTTCSPLEMPEAIFNIENFRLMALNSKMLLFFWITWESALFCINNKLRTPIGKPTDTFLSIENALKELAKEAVGLNSVNGKAVFIQDKTRVCLLLDFMEHLEKNLYNAYEGTADVLVAPSKPVRIFFHTNASTCREWLTRIRFTVITVALHAGSSTSAIRHAQAKLNDLVKANKTEESEFEKTVIKLACAYLNLNEFEALHGLHIWTKDVLKREMPWLKAAADQANNKFEIAITGYLENFIPVLKDNTEAKDETDDSPKETHDNTYLQKFISNQIITCYKSLNCWTDIIFWKEEKDIPMFKENQTDTSAEYQFVKMANAFENNDLSYLQELCEWKNLENKSTKIVKWDVKNVLHETECDIFKIALQLKNVNNKNALDKLTNHLATIQHNVQECVRNLPSEYIQDFLFLQHVTVGLLNIVEKKPGTSFEIVSDFKKLRDVHSSVLSKALLWSEYFRTVENGISHNAVLNLKVNMIKRARKEGNTAFALTEINKYLAIQKKLFTLDENNGHSSNLLDKACNYLIQAGNKLDKNIWSLENAKAVREMVKVLYTIEGKRNIALNVCAAASAGISQQVNLSGSEELKEQGSKLILTLSKWIQQENDQQLVKEVNSPLGRLIMVLPDIGISDNREANVIPTLDMVAGKLLQFGVRQYPHAAKIWSAFGEWCYLWGKNALNNGIQLTDNDKLRVQEHLPADIPAEDLQKIYQILSQAKVGEDKDDLISNDINMDKKVESDLWSVPSFVNLHPDYVSTLMDIWRQSQKNIYHYYELSAEAFFQSLNLSTNFETLQRGTECLTITATLRLLRFIVKHAMELQSVLDTGLANTPTHPWKAIIPQLFSRLNHPEEYVRHRVSELLCRIAQVAPHLIIFPAVAGAVEGGYKFNDIIMPKDYLVTNNEATELGDIDDDNNEIENEESRDVLHSCFKSMVETLSEQAPEAITQVQVFVNELRRISLLWDELWISTLVQHHGEINKRLSQLDTEIQKTLANKTLTKEEQNELVNEKYRIIVKPILFILEQLYTVTTREPETTHEKLFQDRYSELIVDVIDKLKHPQNPQKPLDSCQTLKILQYKFQQRSHKRSSFALKMNDISPVLGAMRDTVIPMPGLARHAIKKVTILSISQQVNVLPTKTKPKKLFFHGSDGHTYTYLFKGMEDLHLDERIMQFLTITNTMMAKTSDLLTHHKYRARHYSVIPLGLRSGLIRWVDGTTPLFSLYKRWQIRDAAASNAKQNNNNSVVLRPSELFYNKLNPLLKENGVKNIENRKEWPHPVLKQVLLELMNETPNYLLAKELWCRSVNVGAWWQIVKNYSNSVAVMSIIGYIIGLGDRHLDNVLIDLTSGEVIHIDYNVCFEKGKQLRVPEKVPFRMTPNMETALGVTGVEGTFRLACETVLNIMQSGRETLLTLLEAFVYDPLVDWTSGGETLAGAILRTVAPSTSTRQARRDLEREVTACMFHVRCAEMKNDWSSNRNDILTEISTITEELNKWYKKQLKLKLIENNSKEVEEQIKLIKEVECAGREHSLYSLPKRFSVYQQTQSCLQIAQKAIEEKILEYEKHILSYSTALSVIKGTQVTKWMQKLKSPSEIEYHKIFDIIKEFLQNAGQTSMVAQCEQIGSEVTQLAQQQLMYSKTCVDLLSQFNAITSLYPSSIMDKHRLICYVKWYKHLLDSKTVESALNVLSEFNVMFSPVIPNPMSQQIITYSCHLQAMLNESKLRLQKGFERLNVEGIPDSGSKLDTAYTETRNSIAYFLQNEKGASVAFECVNITALCALNKRYLTMEAAAANAGEYLVDLTSRDGDWFLDEMHLLSSLVVEIASFISVENNETSTNDENKISFSLDCLKSANNIYKGLQQLNINFHTILLPEAVKAIQSEDITVITMINELNNIILNIDYPLPEILSQLEIHLRFTIMEMESPHQNVKSLISDLRAKFSTLLHSKSSENLTSGQMLLLGFNGLFDKLQEETNNLITTLTSVETPSCWKKIDQFKEAKALAAPLFNEEVRSILDDIFLVKRIQTITEFFTLCRKMCMAFKGVGMGGLYDDERLSKPIKKFTADYVSRQFLGVTPQIIALGLCYLLQRMDINVTNEVEQRDIGAENKVPLEDLCRKAVDLNLKRGNFTGNVLAQASGLCTNLEASWRKREVARYIQQNLEVLRSTTKRLQLQSTAHHWIHEDVIALQSNLSPLSPVVRSSFLLELRKTCATLLAMQTRLTEVREQQKTLIASAEQRLKWASGANPDLNKVMTAFENAVTSMENQINMEQKLAVGIANTCLTLLHHEALRTRTSEALTHDAVFVQLVKNWESSCRLLLECADVSPVELKLIQISPFDSSIDENWVKTTTQKLSDIATEHNTLIAKQEEEMAPLFNSLKSKFANLKTSLNNHHKLFSDVRNLLKTMAKMDDCSTELYSFLTQYRKYLEIFTSVVNKFSKEQNQSDQDTVELIAELQFIKQQTVEIYDQMLHLNGEKNNINGVRPRLIRQESVWMSPRKGIPTTKNKNKKELRNSYATTVWQKIRLKLEGRDPDITKEYSIHDQVDYVIKEATSIDNLALLYEGWTPWV